MYAQINERQFIPEGDRVKFGRQFCTGMLGTLLLIVICGSLTFAAAQQTVFNVPTTDVLDKGKVYVEFDVTAKPNDADAFKKFSSFGPHVVVGTGANIEVGLNIIGNIQPGPD